ALVVAARLTGTACDGARVFVRAGVRALATVRVRVAVLGLVATGAESLAAGVAGSAAGAGSSAGARSVTTGAGAEVAGWACVPASWA
ncbi:MAG: hypothetical protein ACJ8EZ_06465, partial [Sphingomicrobium sp.]